MPQKILVSLLVLMLAGTPLSAEARQFSDDPNIGCSDLVSNRSQKICQAIQSTLEWNWIGPSSVNPGYKLTFAGIRDVYCSLKIDSNDLGILLDLQNQEDARLSNGADWLMRLVASQEGRSNESEDSVFNPGNPRYILVRGCL